MLKITDLTSGIKSYESMNIKSPSFSKNQTTRVTNPDRNKDLTK